MAKQTRPARSSSDVDDANAVTRARLAAEPGDWLSLALEHHDQIRSAFIRAAEAPPGGARLTALKGLAILNNGHSIAEEIVLYPALSELKPKQGDMAYAQQSEAKVEMSRLEQLDPASPDWLVQLEAIRDAVLQHMLEEEEGWFLDLKASPRNQAKLTARYKEEFERYTRTGIVATNAAWDGPARTPASANS